MTNETNPGTVGGRFTQERIAAATAETERLCSELNITNADHIALWLEANMADSSLAWLACRIVEAHEAANAATVQKVGREAFKAGWRTNAVGEETHPASYLDNCEQGDWEEYQRRGINAYLAALTAEPAAKAGDAVIAALEKATSSAEQIVPKALGAQRYKLTFFFANKEDMQRAHDLFIAARPGDGPDTPPSPQPDMGSGREPCPDLFDMKHDEAWEWITTNCMAIRRDNGDMDYSFGAMIKAYEAGKAAALSPPASQSVEKIREALQLAKEALDLAHPYVADVVKEDGGIDHCDIAYRMDLEKIEAASAALSTLPHKEEATPVTQVEGLREALKGALEWIDAIPADVVANLPAMPGFDRDRVDELIAATTERGNG